MGPNDPGRRAMSVCGVSRLLVPAFMVGFGVASLTGTDGYGWVAAAVTVAALVLVRALRGTGGTACAVGPDLPSGDVVDLPRIEDGRREQPIGPRGRSRT